MDNEHPKDWRELCKAAATEVDPEKLMHIIGELTRALDERDKNRQNNHGRVNGDTGRSLQSEPAV